MQPLKLIFLSAVLCCCSPIWAIAAPIHGGSAQYNYFNSFTTRLFPGTPFNMGTDPVDVLVEYEGIFETVWQDQAGSTIDFEIVSIVGNGVFGGLPYQILGGSQQIPLLGPFVGTYTNIVQNPNDPGFSSGEPSSLVSAFRTAFGPFVQQFSDGTVLYGAPYTFEGTIAGLPYPLGSEFFGIADAEIRLQLGNIPDPLMDPVIGLALSDGLVRIIPEPTSALMMLWAALPLVLYRRRQYLRVQLT